TVSPPCPRFRLPLNVTVLPLAAFRTTVTADVTVPENVTGTFALLPIVTDPGTTAATTMFWAVVYAVPKSSAAGNCPVGSPTTRLAADTPRAVALLATRVPLWTVVDPVKVFAPDRVTVPGRTPPSVFVTFRLPAPVTTPATVRAVPL